MKKVFLEELEKKLVEAEISGVKEILNLYENRFLLGKEAGLTEEEVIGMLEDIDTIVKKYKSGKDESKTYELILDLACFSDFDVSIIPGAEVKFDIESGAFKYIEVKREGNKIHLSNKEGNNVYRGGHRYDGRLLIGEDAYFSSFIVNNVTGDFNMAKGKINCDQFEIVNVSGDFNLPYINAKEQAKITTTSGDIRLKHLISPKASMNTISGDVEINELVVDKVFIHTISGDVSIKRINTCECKIESISGDVMIVEGPEDIKVSASSVSGSVEINGKALNVDITSRIKSSMSKFKF
ncbi:MAG: DUF4097 family beta strand repeat-containing protein [Roseburia sp.]|nr:DUF4097 family beta strand repeat-containing protein [Anaeroplasma bactoclasticum]MCM1195950.1 DUF4097 family beta strand repeat-containing protein [Roseburia sp.]MCM1555908.1 DUF4097 family beta strand repeat-containing protein [Anaeroplasma bactoclasticum]